MQERYFNKLREKLSRFASETCWNYYYLSFIAFVFIIASYYLFSWPIIAGDTDLWYHLNSGRYTLEHGHPPYNSFFSFIDPPRDWVDYFWLFQVLVYSVYSIFDYYGLVMLRTGTYLATGALILLFLLKGQDANKRLYLLTVFVFYFIFIEARYNLVRPHTFSYLFIALFIYVLEFKPKTLLYLLPVFSSLWFNLHGIEYPVVFLIILAYLLEFFIIHIKNREHIKKEELHFIIPLVVSLGTIYLTPHGYKLMDVPFVSTKYASIYIDEFKMVSAEDLLSFNFIKMMPTYNTIFNLLFITICLSVIKSIWLRSIRISHLLMFIGGTVLLTKLGRFRYEFLLLALPVVKASSFDFVSIFLNKKRVITAAALILFCFTYFNNNFNNPPKYPFSPKNLPEGITAFLNHIDKDGSVLNHPNNGGYLQWMLYPKYKILMDMEVPFLFTDEDFHTASALFSSEAVFKKVIERYKPDFISVPMWHNDFRNTVKNFRDYAIVFFDDAEVLYVNKNKHPDIFVEYDMKGIDPFSLIGRDIASIKNDKDLFLEQLSKIIGIYPGSRIANQIMAMIYNEEGEFQKAVPYEESIIRDYPEMFIGYRLKGISLAGLNRYSEAVAYYTNALKKADESQKQGIQREIGLAYLKLKDYKKAYNALKKGVNIFAHNADYKDLYDLGSAAFMLGKTDEAIMIYRLAYEKVPLDNTEWQEKIKKHLQLLGITMR